MKKIISLLIAFLIAFSSFNVSALTYYNKVENPNLNLPEPILPPIENGSILLEAETGIMSENASVVGDTGASEGLAVKFNPASWASTVSESDKSPSLKLDFEVTNSDSYTVWGYIKAADTGSDSVYIAANGDIYSSVYFTAKSSWQWAKLTTVVLEKGNAFVALKYREKNFIIDKIIITSNSSFKPTEKNDYPAPDGTDSGVLNNLFPEPSIKPIKGHPRVFLTPEYVEVLNSHITHPEIAPAWETVVNAAEQKLSSELPNNPSGNYDSNIVNWVQCRALLYALGKKDEAWAKETILHARNVLGKTTFPQISDITRQMGTVMTMGAVVYDWCYDHMTEDDKTFFIKKFKQICSLKEIGYPPKATIVATGSHMGEYEIHRDMLSCGIACYDEDPEMYNLGAGALFSRYVEPRKLFNSSGNHPQGSAYGPFRLGCELFADLIFTRMGYPAVYGEDIEKVMLRYIYARRPDGLIMKDGDDYELSARADVTDYSLVDWTALIILNGLYDDPYVRGQFMKELSMQGYSKDAFWLVLCADPGKDFEFSDILPTAYKSSYPLTQIFHRTSWQNGVQSNTAIASFKAYERNLRDHMHLDSGSFQLYYKGALAIDAGNYQGKGGGWGSEHDFSYNKRTIAHNLITVYDPEETFFNSSNQYVNDGGQRMMTAASSYEALMMDDKVYAENKASFIGPNQKTPAISYLKSDLKPGYSDKVSAYNRSMVFLDLFDEDYPAAFIVFDNITSSNKDFEKNWLLHSIEEPVVDGNTTVISRTEDGYSGKLVNKTMLPADFTIDKVGGEGKEAWVNGSNFANEDSSKSNSEQGAWRIELSPKKKSENDVFLNAMYVTDNNKNLPELPMYQESESGMVGVTVKDRMVMFARDTKVKNNSISLTVRDNGYNNVLCFIADIEDGIWNISGEGISINAEAKEGENTLCFNVKPGSYVISKTNTPADEFVWNEETKSTYGDFDAYDTVDGAYLRIDVPTKLISGVPYVAAKTFFALLDADVIWDSERGCAVAIKNGLSIELYGGSDSFVMNGTSIKLTSPIFVENGIMFVPILYFKTFLGFNMNYDHLARILNISIVEPSKEVTDKIDVSKVLRPALIKSSGNDGNVESNILDFSIKTRWSCEGKGSWLMYDLGESKDISSLYVAFYSGNKRKTNFDIEISDDGVNFVKVFSGESSGKTLEPEAISIGKKARFIKFTGYGTSTGTAWNSVTEMIPIS